MMRSLLDIALPRHEVLIGEQKANMPGARRMTFSESLAPRSVAALDTVQEILGTLVARYRKDEVLTVPRGCCTGQSFFLG
jgi:hypothetical protein